MAKQGFHHGFKELFKPVTKRVKDSSKEILRETETKTAAIQRIITKFFGAKTTSVLADTHEFSGKES